MREVQNLSALLRSLPSSAFRLPAIYFSARFLSQAGQGVFITGLFVLAGQQNSTAIGLSSLIVAMTIAAIVLGLPGGALADRLGAPRGLVFGAIGRTAVMALALALSGRPELAALVAFAYSGVSQVYSPSELAMVDSVAPRRVAGAHSLLVALQHTGQGGGVVILAPAAYLIGGAPAMIGTGVALYVVVTLLALILAGSRLPAAPVSEARHAFNFSGTLGYLTREPRALYAGSLLAFSEVASKAMIIAVPLYLAQDLRLDALEPAAILVPAIVGGFIGLAWSARALHLHIAPQVMRLTLLGTVAAAIALAGLGDGLATLTELGSVGFGSLQNPVHMSVAVAMPVALLLGMCFVVAPIGARTVLTATAPRGEHGRVFATQATLTDVLALAPLALAGIGTEMAGARVVFLVIGAMGVVLFAALELLSIRRQSESRRAPMGLLGPPSGNRRPSSEA